MRFLWLAVLAIQALAQGRAGKDSYAEIQEWRQQREAALKSEGGWLTVAGLFWLKAGENRVGTSEADEISLPPGSAPVRVGVITLQGDRVVFQAARGVEAKLNGQRMAGAELRPDTSGKQDAIQVGRLTLLLLKRADRYAIRLKDPESRMRREFAGLRWFPVDKSWRVAAKLVRFEASRRVVFDTMAGVKIDMDSPGYVEFRRGGNRYRLEPVREGQELFFVFRDATSGKSTYGGGRFLYAHEPRSGTVVLDFNRAVNPPCAYTPYATCPLAPKQNQLSLSIEAGEKKYPGSVH